MDNIFADLPGSLPEELVTVLAESQSVRIERIVSTGHATPDGEWYDQDQNEWVLLVQGEAELTWADGRPPTHLLTGDHLLIPAHVRHRVEWTSATETTVWLAVFFNSDSSE